MSLYALVRVDDPATNYKLAQTGLHGRTLAITPEDIAMLRQHPELHALANKLEALLS